MSQNTKTTVWNYNGSEFTLDLEEQEDIVRFERAVDVLSKREKELPEGEKLSAINAAYCAAYFEFFDSVFGAGSSGKIFGGRKNARLCDEVYFDSFIPFIRNQVTQKNSRSRLRARQNEELRRKSGGNKRR